MAPRRPPLSGAIDLRAQMSARGRVEPAQAGGAGRRRMLIAAHLARPPDKVGVRHKCAHAPARAFVRARGSRTRPRAAVCVRACVRARAKRVPLTHRASIAIARRKYSRARSSRWYLARAPRAAVRARVRARVRVCVCEPVVVNLRVCARACEREKARACVRARLCCVCVCLPRCKCCAPHVQQLGIGRYRLLQ
jgi:hypothetical protein